jgi:hypothetical protein
MEANEDAEMNMPDAPRPYAQEEIESIRGSRYAVLHGRWLATLDARDRELAAKTEELEIRRGWYLRILIRRDEECARLTRELAEARAALQRVRENLGAVVGGFAGRRVDWKAEIQAIDAALGQPEKGKGYDRD